MDWRGWVFLVCLLCGTGLLLAGVLRSAGENSREAVALRKAFQHRIGGLGMGSVVVPAWNFRDYDPRLQPVANDELYPLPGGYSYSPDRLSMVSSFAGLAPK